MIKITTLIPAISLLLLFPSCLKEEELISRKDGDLQYVTVNIDVTAGNMSALTGTISPGTKSISPIVATTDTGDALSCEAVLPDASLSYETKTWINDPLNDPGQTIIKNLWVIQFDGTGDGAKLIGNPIYISDYTVVGNRKAKLVASTVPNTLFFLANTFDNSISFPLNLTIAGLKSRLFVTKSLGTILSADPMTRNTGSGTFPNDADYYQRLNGYVEQIIDVNHPVVDTLSHNVCRISLSIKNKTKGKANPVTLISADIENVPGCVYYFTDYSGYTSGNNKGKPFNHGDFSHYGLFDYQNVITWTGTEGTDSTSAKTVRLYLSANESGTVLTNTDAKLKSLFAPSTATTLRIYGTYKDSLGSDIPIKYTFALGDNMTNNYQLVPNGDYAYNITIKAKGDKTSDPRVAYNAADGVDYRETSKWPLSNCYICNPPSVVTKSNTFQIPVVRVDQFWGADGNNTYENIPTNCIGGQYTSPWKVYVIWSDMKVEPGNIVITKDHGVGSGFGQGEDGYFEVSVPGTTEMGNVLIGLKKTDSGGNPIGDWLWSWHLWVTDYCPDEAAYLVQQGAFLSGTDTYHVSGGDVQRYRAVTGTTVQKVFMDRSIGAMSTDYVGSGKGMLYYQHGRKDPFPGSGTYYEEGINEMTNFIINSGSTRKNCVDYKNTGTNGKNVPYSVKNPTMFIFNSSGYWSYGDIYYESSVNWNDPYTRGQGGGKSIFDPSPSGWRVPYYSEVQFANSDPALYYYKYVTGISSFSTSIIKGAGTVSYVMAGYRNKTSGTLSHTDGNYGYYWVAYSNDRTSSNVFTMRQEGAQWNNNGLSGGLGQKAYGYQIRPVQQ